MVDYAVRDNELAVGDETVSFEVSIDQHLEFDEFVVVRLTNTRTDHPDKFRNVIAVDADGSIRWKLPEQPPSAPRPYTRLFTKDDELWVNNFSGHVHRIDLETGELLDSKFVK